MLEDRLTAIDLGRRDNGPITSRGNHRAYESYKGDAKLIPVFKGESGENEETKRFIYMFEQVALEARWSDFYQRAVFESKLEGKARIRYFEGIGRNDALTIHERIDCIRSMFIKTEGIEEQENKFYRCRQAQEETVKVFRYRLESLSIHFKKRMGDDHISYRNILNRQFMIGLKPEIAREVAKRGESDYEANVAYAVIIEESINKYPVKALKINAISDNTSKEITDLKKQVSESQKQLLEANKALRDLNERFKTEHNTKCGTVREQCCYSSIL